MQFLEPNEIWEWCTQRSIALVNGQTIVDDPSLERIAEFSSAPQGNPKGHEARVARDCVDSLGGWEECLLWLTLWGVWPSTEDWPNYYRERGVRGERRSLDDAPGHLFDAQERNDLIQFLTMALESGWEGHILPVINGHPSGKRAFVSHDEWIAVYVLPSNTRPAS